MKADKMHESKKLNGLIGKQVEITFFDNDIADRKSVV